MKRLSLRGTPQDLRASAALVAILETATDWKSVGELAEALGEPRGVVHKALKAGLEDDLLETRVGLRGRLVTVYRAKQKDP